jgi:broad specificity phosphatase PhoE
VEIVLVRHGEPAPSTRSPITGRDIGRFARAYNALGLSKTSLPPAETQELAALSPCVVCSDLRRSIESAQYLAPGRDIEIDPELREASLPDSLDIPLTLPPGAWLVIARVAWWLNVGRAADSLAQTRVRASLATDRLCARADLRGSVLVVGHGMFNRFIAAELKRRRWRGPTLLPWAYWAAAQFTRS